MKLLTDCSDGMKQIRSSESLTAYMRQTARWEKCTGECL
jgi:hypothetical protein